MTATEIAQRIRHRQLSAVEVMEAHLARIDEVNGRVNAIVTLLPEKALESARQADEKIHSGNEAGPLHAKPIAQK